MIPEKHIAGQPQNNILSKNIRVPEWWVDHKTGLFKTKAELDYAIANRNCPDPSYDLDGDNVVNARDYFLSKQFDQDMDGRLNSTERKNALSALRGSYENLFKWNLEAAGPYRGGRVIQVRGKIVDAEDFSKIRETYPDFPLSKQPVRVSSLPKLRAERKADIM